MKLSEAFAYLQPRHFNDMFGEGQSLQCARLDLDRPRSIRFTDAGEICDRIGVLQNSP